MNFILVKVVPDGNGIKDVWTNIAISNDKNKLIEYCLTTFGMQVETAFSSTQVNNFSWDGWYIIVPSQVIIL